MNETTKELTAQNPALNRVTGILVIEARDSNPNGDPDNEGEPRQRGHDQRGMISGVSLKRKLRDLVEATDGPVWHAFKEELKLDTNDFHILESRGRDRVEIGNMKKSEFQKKYWDARIFGTTFLESIKETKKKPEEVEHFIRAGAIQFGNGISISPVRIERMTTTNKSGVQEGKDRGMAPLGYRVVEHGVYIMPFFLNPTAAVKSGCQALDIELFKKLIPLVYSHNSAHGRPNVGIRHAWWIEHKSPLGSCSDFAILDCLTPKKRNEPDKPSTSWSDYEVPLSLVEDLQNRIKSCTDLALL